MKAQAKPLHGDIEIQNFVQADAESLPFGDKSFDVAVLSEILEHVNNPVVAIQEARRVAHFVIICVPNEYLWSEDKKPFSPVELSGHKRRFTSESIITTAREAGIEILEYLDWQYLGWAYFIIIGR
jgi:SAM-dependent methyltransferase